MPPPEYATSTKHYMPHTIEHPSTYSRIGTLSGIWFGVRSGSIRGPFGIRAGSVRGPFGLIFQKISICAAVAAAAGALPGGGARDGGWRTPTAAATAAPIENF